MSKVVIYSTPTCAYCKLAKQYFEENKVEYEEKNVFEDLKAREEMVTKSQQMGVPVIDIDGQIIIGFNKPEIESALGK